MLLIPHKKTLTYLSDYMTFLQIGLRKKGTKHFDRTEYKLRRLLNKMGGLTSDKLENLQTPIEYVKE